MKEWKKHKPIVVGDLNFDKPIRITRFIDGKIYSYDVILRHVELIEDPITKFLAKGVTLIGNVKSRKK